MKISQLIEHLQKVYDPDDVVAYDLWSVSDVFDEAVDLDIPDVVTEEQAVEVLERMQRYKDATVGMNWDVLNHHLGEVMREHVKQEPEGVVKLPAVDGPHLTAEEFCSAELGGLGYPDRNGDVYEREAMRKALEKFVGEPVDLTTKEGLMAALVQHIPPSDIKVEVEQDGDRLIAQVDGLYDAEKFRVFLPKINGVDKWPDTSNAFLPKPNESDIET